jgi:hypothetical protein
VLLLVLQGRTSPCLPAAAVLAATLLEHLLRDLSCNKLHREATVNPIGPSASPGPTPSPPLVRLHCTNSTILQAHACMTTSHMTQLYHT